MSEDQAPYIVTGKSKSPRGPTLARAKRAINEVTTLPDESGSFLQKAKAPSAPQDV